ncbi:CsbD family protein [Bordetella genomosp. 1]|uniref:CsbD family protein n=1 Tax=Bordetella genomosp. 1 TaxID=1395607 RepID=A0A261S8B0_9BORD|nr:CsbD family protein [Bordetella genomosp. 1]MDQ8034942.1 CsbD family protein [Bordetella sp.]OZI32663.1 CsbD family protein [Bordetella genomosp. 1]OZI65978.1 CsbD family protein [Bordetella genomosp. 1]
MSVDRAAGKVKELVGRGEEAFGDAFSDSDARLRGVARQVEGKVQNAYGAVANNLDDVADSVTTLVRRHPVGAVLAVGLVAYLLGRVRGSFGRD